MNENFRKFARGAAWVFGTPWAFVAALSVVVVWALSGPAFGFSETWQLVINTGTTIVTFLMVFIIQNTQNRDSRALHLKLDELIEAVTDARDELVDIEEGSEEEMQQREEEYREHREHVAAGQ